ncbi:MAG: VOC family protein [Chloroflexi bacterium]|nr:MAG: VOC family protein [Chloroflexota bacterium]
MCRSAWVNCSGYPARHEHNRAQSRHRLLFRHRQGSPSLTEFAQLDYLYTPSSDVAGDARFFTEVLGGKLAFAVEGMGARVAMIELTDGPPHVLLTDHLEGDRAIYIYRVGDLRKAVAALKKRGLKGERQLEIPMGPCSSFVLPSGHRIALYEASRPEVLKHFLGRKDF